MIRFYDSVARSSEHCFIPLSVQLFTKRKNTLLVCESHPLIQTLFESLLLESCPQFVASLRGHSEEHKEEDAGGDALDSLRVFDARTHKAEWTNRWALSKKSTHILYDIRYLLSIEHFMSYLCLESRHDPLPRFWKHQMNLLSTFQDSKWQHRQSGRDHVLQDDQSMINVLRLDSSLSGTNHRYILHGLHVLFTNIKGGTPRSGTATNHSQSNLERASAMVLDAMLYGLSLIVQRPMDHFAARFPDRMEVDEEAAGNTHAVTMRLDNCDGGHVECRYFRTDRDDFSLISNLSKLLIHLAKVLEDHRGWTFSELMDRLRARHRDRNGGQELGEEVVFCWLDLSLQFVAVLNHFHADLLKKNGGVLATLIFNIEKANFFSLFMSHHFFHVASHATELLGPSNFMALLFHRHGIYHWFCRHRVQLQCSDERVSASDLAALSADTATGWRHWMDSSRVQKVWSRFGYL